MLCIIYFYLSYCEGKWGFIDLEKQEEVDDLNPAKPHRHLQKLERQEESIEWNRLKYRRKYISVDFAEGIFSFKRLNSSQIIWKLLYKTRERRIELLTSDITMDWRVDERKIAKI